MILGKAMTKNIISGYIGNAKNWRLLVDEILSQCAKSNQNLWLFEPIVMDKLQSYWQLITKEPKYPLSTTQHDLPPSYVHLWESGVILFFDKLAIMFAPAGGPR